MKARALLDHFARRGISLRADGAKLRYAAPPGVLTDQDKAELAANKASILAALAAPEPAAPWRADWSLAELLEAWNERVGIMRDSGIPLAEAERLAWDMEVRETLH